MKELDLIKNKNYLLACSYGPDSMALFYLLEKNGISFDVAHVNFGLRKEAAHETNRLTAYCHKHNVPIYTLMAEVDRNNNIEDECRKIRYKFFKMLSDKFGYDAVLVAHHQDDLLETYLMQKKRRNLPKLYGIAEKTFIFEVNIQRPLLNYSKKDLIDICQNNYIPYSIDSSNNEDDYLRNRIRHRVIEKLTSKERQDLIKEIAAKNDELNNVFSLINKSNIHDIKTLLSFDEITYLYAINESASSLDKSLIISKKRGLEIRKILSSKKPNVVLKITDKILFVKEYDAASFKFAKNQDNFSLRINGREVIDCDHFYLDLTGDISNLNITDDSFPITVRIAQPKDKTLINGYQVEARRLFIDWKMPLSIREQWPVIEDKSHNVIYIPRYQKDFVNDKKRNFYVKLH